ncbi:hypothetical protein JWZ98_07655 [Methylomonas sp. EFPC1]|uniref:Uncharacterized protein n=1 Tax=Methylomonas defluvii TaxID=3045149 RepID=A0ABU4UAV7_9GAMM|nr:MULTISPECIES: hypothetical protein [unclassified Methylomonas]MDX8126313.1 hypothetical protein [Methylomonas sp. OY6]NOV28715.1 hypothetical protein [Methylomonas sp. ZR1]QSB02800.1 hypothetical protein JWZ98_07655 [Methylomonas sp. EFPC1]
MVAQIISFPEQKSSNKLAVSFRFLLSLYAIVPLCLLVLWLDEFGFNFALRDMLPSSPTHFLLFQILFGTPHIVASNLLLVSHQDYLQAFKGKLIAMTLFIMVFFGIGSLFIPYRALYIITACWTVYHVLKQQQGIAKAVCRLPNWAFYLQLWLSVSAGIFIYMGIFLKNSLEPEQAALVLQIASVLTTALVISTVFCQRYVPSRLGIYFLWANTLLVVSSWYVYSQQYYFLAILMPRLVHDITAYSFYVTHDVNRHSEQPQNNLFRAATAIRLPVWLVLPLLSFVLTYLLQAYGDDLVNLLLQTLFSTQIYKAVTLGFLGYLALMHYYTEAFVWAAGSPLRRYIRFSGV